MAAAYPPERLVHHYAFYRQPEPPIATRVVTDAEVEAFCDNMVTNWAYSVRCAPDKAQRIRQGVRAPIEFFVVSRRI